LITLGSANTIHRNQPRRLRLHQIVMDLVVLVVVQLLVVQLLGAVAEATSGEVLVMRWEEPKRTKCNEPNRGRNNPLGNKL
jgi:hypothetical protein